AYASQSVAFLAAVAVVPFAVRALVARASIDIRGAIEGAALPISGAPFDAPAFATLVLSLVVPALAVIGLAGAAAHVVQTGGTVATGRLAPRLDRLDPLAGARALASGARIFAVGRALVAACAVAWLAYRDLADRIVDIARVAGRASWTAVVVADVAG